MPPSRTKGQITGNRTVHINEKSCLSSLLKQRFNYQASPIVSRYQHSNLILWQGTVDVISAIKQVVGSQIFVSNRQSTNICPSFLKKTSHTYHFSNIWIFQKQYSEHFYSACPSTKTTLSLAHTKKNLEEKKCKDHRLCNNLLWGTTTLVHSTAWQPLISPCHNYHTEIPRRLGRTYSAL